MACRYQKAQSDNADPHPACLLGSAALRDLPPGGPERCKGNHASFNSYRPVVY